MNFKVLEQIRRSWGDSADGFCEDIAEAIVAQLGGEFLQFYAASDNMSGYHCDYLDFGRAYSINTPFNGEWHTKEYVFHTVTIVDNKVVGQN